MQSDDGRRRAGRAVRRIDGCKLRISRPLRGRGMPRRRILLRSLRSKRVLRTTKGCRSACAPSRNHRARKSTRSSDEVLVPTSTVDIAHAAAENAGVAAPAKAASEGARTAASLGLSETSLRNVALEAVRTGSYWAPPEQQQEVLEYIASVFLELLGDARWLKKAARKLERESALTRRYSVTEILAQRPEADGFDPFATAEKAVATATGVSAAEVATTAASIATTQIGAGTQLVAKESARIFETTSSWNVIGRLSPGQRLEAAASPVAVDSFCMVPIRPAGAVEHFYLTVCGLDATAKGTMVIDTVGGDGGAAGGAAAGDPASGAAERDPRRLMELQERLTAAVNANGSTTAFQLLALLEDAGRTGELGAAVFCGERLLEVRGTAEQMTHEELERAFAALKPLLRPGAAVAPSVALQGPWSKSSSGRAGAPNHRKGLGQLLAKISSARRACQAAAKGEDALLRTSAAADAIDALGELARATAPLMAANDAASRCRRRGALVKAAADICSEHGLVVSINLAWVVVGELENLGFVKSHGREIALSTAADASKTAAGGEEDARKNLDSLRERLPQLETLATERMEKRRKRQLARDRVRSSKRRRAEEA